MTQLAEVVEYTNYIPAEGVRSCLTTEKRQGVDSTPRQ